MIITNGTTTILRIHGWEIFVLCAQSLPLPKVVLANNSNWSISLTLLIHYKIEKYVRWHGTLKGDELVLLVVPENGSAIEVVIHTLDLSLPSELVNTIIGIKIYLLWKWASCWFKVLSTEAPPPSPTSPNSVSPIFTVQCVYVLSTYTHQSVDWTDYRSHHQ